MQTITAKRNKIITGKNSQPYNEKHRSAIIHIRPIGDAISLVPKLYDLKGFPHIDYKTIDKLKKLRTMPKPQILKEIRAILVLCQT
jgi:hypothetical protein